MRRKKGAVIDGARFAQFEEWHASQPKSPKEKRPQFKSTDDGIFGFFTFLALAGLVVGLIIIVVSPAPEMPTISGVIFWSGPLLYPAVSIGLMLLVSMVKDSVESRTLEQSGWAQYDRDLERWKLIGDEDFGDLARTDRMINLRMWSVYDGYPPRVEDTPAKSGNRLFRRRPTNGPKLEVVDGDIDDELMGKRHSISLASSRRFRREARHLARHKAACEARGERFIAQISVPARRELSRSSSGWYSNMSIAEWETAAIRKEVTPYFEAAGLRVTKCWLSWNGMSVGVNGNYETLGVVVRVA